MNKTLCLLTVAGLAFAAQAVAANPALSSHNVVWNSPSTDSLDSMPLSGRGGAGANVWVQDGSLWLYLAHNAAYDEHGRLLKLGCVRMTPTAAPGLTASDFRQELDLASGAIRIQAGGFAASLWFAGETLLIETSSAKPQALEVAFGTWRDRKRDGLKLDVWGSENVQSDRVVAGTNGITWSHHNADYPQDIVGKAKSQGIPKEAICDPTERLVFGGALAAEGGLSPSVANPARWHFWDGTVWTAKTTSRKQHVLAIHLDAERDGQPRDWLKLANAALYSEWIRSAKVDEQKRWNAFWQRSHIVVDGGKGAANQESDGWRIGRNYQLFRYMLACNRDGALPLLFNGGIFTTDNKPGRITGNNNDELKISPGEPSTPDFRRWMGCRFMSQNQRWLGWPTLANGDTDLLEPSLAFYRDRAATAAARAKTNGADGMVYPEPLDIWGLCCVGPRPDGLCGAQHLTYHFSMMLEHAWMALQARDALGLSLAKDLPWIEGTVFFYDSFYRKEARQRTGKELGPDGRLVLHPACGLEFAGGATDPIEAVCGLKRVTAGLLALPELSPASRARLQQLQTILPDLPIGRRQGRPALLPAKTWERDYNKWEPIEMYAYWPYRFAGITQPDTLQLARDTWETIPADRARLCKQDYSWMANVVNMAALAWPEEAKKRAIYKMANTAAPQARFPAFFGPGHDWLPDHNWGGSGMTGIQEMLLAPEPGPAGKLHLFAGWPAEWDVDFKLHAPGPTVVEGELRDGKLVTLKVTPESRAKDIVNWLGRSPAYQPPPPPPVPLSQGKTVTVSSQFAETGYDPARAVDGDLKTRWASDFAARSGWIAIDLGEEKEIGRVWLSEIEWPETREFTLEIQQGDAWKEIARGTTLGADKDITFAPAKARHVRLNVLKAIRPININEFQIFAPDSATK